jgi:hypothetical protein
LRRPVHQRAHLTFDTAILVALHPATANQTPEKQELSGKAARPLTLYLPTEIQIPLGSVNR